VKLTKNTQQIFLSLHYLLYMTLVRAPNYFARHTREWINSALPPRHHIDRSAPQLQGAHRSAPHTQTRRIHVAHTTKVWVIHFYRVSLQSASAAKHPRPSLESKQVIHFLCIVHSVLLSLSRFTWVTECDNKGARVRPVPPRRPQGNASQRGLSVAIETIRWKNPERAHLEPVS
jgi:hypothetical protein